MKINILTFLLFIFMLVGCGTNEANNKSTRKLSQNTTTNEIIESKTVSKNIDASITFDVEDPVMVIGDSITINFTYDRSLGIFPSVTSDNAEVIKIKSATTRVTITALKEGVANVKIRFNNTDYFIVVTVVPNYQECEFNLFYFDSFDINVAVNQEIDLSYHLTLGGKVVDGATLEFLNDQTKEFLSSLTFKSSEKGTFTFTLMPKYKDLNYKSSYKTLTINVYDIFDELTEKSYKYIGRVNQKFDKYRFDNVNSGIELSFFGTTLDAIVVNESTVKGRVKVIIDDTITKYIPLLSYNESKHINIEGLSNSIHTARIINVFEENFTFSLDLSTIQADAYSELKKRDYTMLVLGDSITCGYGVYGDDSSYEVADSSLAYSYLIATKLNAEYEMVSSRGIGVKYGHRGEQNMIDLYNRVSIPDYNKKYENTSHDIVIINLGTNDGAKLDDYAKEEKGFKGYYLDLLKEVKEDNPNALIFCIYGMMGNGPSISGPIAQAVDEINKEYETGKCFAFFSFSIAQVGHPIISEHKVNADKLYAFMIEKINEYLK